MLTSGPPPRLRVRFRRPLLLGVVASLGAAVFVGTPAVAAGEFVTTVLRYQDETGERVPVPGVAVSVARDGEIVAQARTDDAGEVLVPVTGPGRYTLTVDPTGFPQGVSLRDPERLSTEVQVVAGQTGRTLFPLVSGDGGESGGGDTGRRVAQLGVEGIKLGLFLGMAAIGLSLVFGTTGLTNFAHGEMVTWGMLVAYFFNVYGLAGMAGFMAGWPPPFGSGVNLILAALLAVLLGAAAGWALDRFVFGPIRRRGVTVVSAMIVSIGLSLVIRYVFLFVFGGSPRFFKDYTAQSALQLGIVQITPKDLVATAAAVLILVGVGVFLETTRIGKAMRAVSDNRDLAESSGIDVERVVRYVWVAGGALAALGGVFMGLSEQVAWNSGFRILLLLFAGTVLGGLGTAYGALVGSLVVGVGIQVSTLFVPTELKNVGALALLIVVLIVRPQGILGRAERVG